MSFFHFADQLSKSKTACQLWLRRMFYWGRARQCPICGANLRAFCPLDESYSSRIANCGFPYELRTFETLNVDEYSCPICLEPDRARLIALWVTRWSSHRSSTLPWRLLDFAPGAALTYFLRSVPGVRYRSADLCMPNAQDHVDITDLPYPNGSFDGIICSHVLEHVPNDKLALQELFRILSPGGWVLLLVPLPLGLQVTDEETPSETRTADARTRWHRFGQGDHVRVYAKSDFLTRIRAAGFGCTLFGLEQIGEEDTNRIGLARTSLLYVAEKPTDPSERLSFSTIGC